MGALSGREPLARVGFGRPCVPQGVQKYGLRDENGSNFGAFWRDFVGVCILMLLMTVSYEIHAFAAGRRSKEGDSSSQRFSFQHALRQGASYAPILGSVWLERCPQTGWQRDGWGGEGAGPRMCKPRCPTPSRTHPLRQNTRDITGKIRWKI